jgi:hypothetical protein
MSTAGARTEGAFYVPVDDDVFDSTELTRGPWSPDHQHAGPPTALLGRALAGGHVDDEDGAGGDGSGRRIGRATFEILAPIPIAPLEVRTRLVRPGLSVELFEGELLAGGEPVILARAWRLRLGSAPAVAPTGTRPDPPDAGVEPPFFDTGADVGYHTAMDWRFVRGAFREPGPATVWLRMRVALVAGEEPSPLARVLAAADSGNGVSAALDPARHLFVNTDLTVHLHRYPVGPWVCLDAATTVAPDGIGLADSALHDEEGTIGRSLQTLLVRPRDG